MISTNLLSTRARPLKIAAPIAMVIASILAVVADIIIAGIAHAAGASSAFKPLSLSSYAPLTVVGIVAGAIGWIVIRARAAHPAALLRWLAPSIVVLTWIPDVAVGASKSMAYTTWGAVAALMVMHLAVAVAAIVTFTRLLNLEVLVHSRVESLSQE